MTKLKTLEDIKGYFCKGIDTEEHVRVKDLRKECIKWIKKIDNQIEKHNKRDFKGFFLNYQIEREILGLIAKREWIKHFCNITEEELK